MIVVPRKKKLLAIMLIALFIIPSVSLFAAANPQQGPGNNGGGMEQGPAANMSIKITPNMTSIDMEAVVPVKDKNLTMLNGNMTIKEDKNLGVVNADLELQAFYKQLENVTGKLNMTVSAASTMDLANKTSTIKEETSTNANATITTENGTLTIALKTVRNSIGIIENMSSTITTNTSTIISMNSRSSQGTVSLTLNINSTKTTLTTKNATITVGSFKGPLVVTVPVSGLTMTINLDLNGNYTAILKDGKVEIDAIVNITADSSLVAGILYQEIVSLIQDFNLTNTVKAELNGNTITLIVSYNGSIRNIMMPGIGGIASQDFLGFLENNGTSMIMSHFQNIMENTTIAPSPAANGRISVELNGALCVKVENGSVNMSATATLRSPDLLQTLPYSIEKAEAMLALENTTGMPTLKMEFNATFKTPEPFTTIEALRQATWLALHTPLLKERIMNQAKLNITVMAENGVKLIVNGTKKDRIKANNTGLNMFEKLALEYDGIEYMGAGKQMIVKNAVNGMVPLPPTAKQIIVENMSRVVFKLPFSNATLLSNLTVTFGSGSNMTANITIMKGAMINGSLATAVITPENITLPPGYNNMQPSGYALSIANTTGKAQICLKVNVAGNVMILVIHDNGTIELVKPLKIENGMAIAVVSTHSEYIPVTQQTSGGTQETTTTTTTSTTQITTGTTTTTSSATSTVTSTLTTTTAPITTTSPLETTTTSTTNPQTTTTTTTSTTQITTGTTTTTSSTSSTTSTSQTSASSMQSNNNQNNQNIQNNQGGTQGSNKKNMIVILIAIIVVLIAAAALIFR